MTSPFTSGGNVGGGWGPPSGLAALIAQDKEMATSGRDGMRQLGEGLEKMASYAEETKRARKALQAMDPEHRDEYETLGRGELLGRLDAAAWKRAEDIAKARQKAEEDRIKIEQAQEARAALEAEARKRFAQVVGAGVAASPGQEFAPTMNWNPEAPAATWARRSLNPMETVQAGIQSGLSLDDVARVGQAMKYAETATESGEIPEKFIEDPVSGSRYLARGNTTLPSGINPKIAVAQGPTISPDGQYYHTGKAWVRIRDVGAPSGSKFVNLNGVVALQTPDGRVIEWRLENPMAPLYRDVMPKSEGDKKSGATGSSLWDQYQKSKGQ